MSYPPIYIINLKRNPERKLYMQRQLDAFNLGYQFINAVDKHDLLSKKYRTILAHQLGIEEHHFEYMYEKLGIHFACALSHIKVHNLMIENNIARACVLEDDGYLLPSFPKILTGSQEIPWDILMLSSQSGVMRRIITKIFANAKSTKKLKLFRLCYHFLKLLQQIPINLYMMRLVLSTVVKHITLERNTISKSEEENTKKYVEACTCIIGTLPVQGVSRYQSVLNHYAAQPHIHHNQYPYYPTSCMGYMLTLTAAIKWKQVATSIPIRVIDKIPGELYLKENLNLHVIVPPCIVANLNYLIHSPREK